MKINVLRQFSRYPAGRYISDGPFSGEAFREKFLIPALDSGESIEIEMDGARGYGSSFLEEAFGGLVRRGHSAKEVLKKLKIISADPYLEKEIKEYIRNAQSN